MGTSLSLQERLFVERQWPQLLEEAARADVASYDDDVSGRRVPQSEFRLSFVEWQAFLALLERRGNGNGGGDKECGGGSMRDTAAASSQLCARLSRAQLHCPLVVLTVHACAWWCGAIDAQMLRARLTQLQQLMRSDAATAGTATAATAATPNDEDNTTAASGDDDDDEHRDDGDNDSRRARLTRALRQRLASGRARLQRRGSAARVRNSDDNKNNSNSSASSTADVHLPYMHETAQALQLLTHVLPSATMDGDDDEGRDRHTARSRTTAASPRHERAQQSLYTALCTSADGSRPVAHVALALVLALVAAAASSPDYALAGVAVLRSLTATMSRALDSSRAANENSSSSGNNNDSSRRSRVLLDEWPLLARLDAALARRQREVDVRECGGRAGRRVVDALAAARRARQPRVPLAALSPSARWDVCAAQFVGQRHTWQTLKAFFVSADMFKRDKATVLVFFGPSGYGKSEMAKRVAAALHPLPRTSSPSSSSSPAEAARAGGGDDVATTIDALEAAGKLVYIHMPSFCTREGIYSLVDPPAAHVGDGMLLSALHRHPDAVVVLDEFEKGTAEAVQHLWLSAFQKHGTLRSLKDAARSVSTVRTTFVLTCNLLSDVIEAQAERYLRGTAAERARMRDAYARGCRARCVAELGEPFANRVDFYCPFVPYTADEREAFVYMQLERLLAAQAARQRVLHVTPRFVRQLVQQQQTFHAATVEAVVRPLLVAMATRHVRSAVATVEEHARDAHDSRYVLLPAFARDVAEDDAAMAAAAADDDDDGCGGRRYDEDGGERVYVAEAWDALPGGAAVLQQWRDDDDDGVAAADENSTRASATRRQRDDRVAPPSPPRSPPPPTSAHTAVTTATGTAVHEGRVVQLETARELALERELARVRQTCASARSR